MSLVGALRRCIGTGRDPSPETNFEPRYRPWYTAFDFAAQAMNIVAWAGASSPRATPVARSMRRRRGRSARRAGRQDLCPPPPCESGAAQVQGIGAAIQHATKPVQGSIRVGAAHRLVQGGDLIVKASPPLSNRRRLRDSACSTKSPSTSVRPAVCAAVRTCSSRFRVRQAIPIGKTDQSLSRLIAEFQSGTMPCPCSLEQRQEICFGEGFEHVNGRATTGQR